MAGEVIRTSLAVQEHFPRIRAHDAVDDVHERRLAGAVLAGERMDLASAQLEVDAAQRAGSGRKTSSGR